jgi:hypothetical protein
VKGSGKVDAELSELCHNKAVRYLLNLTVFPGLKSSDMIYYTFLAAYTVYIHSKTQKTSTKTTRLSNNYHLAGTKQGETKEDHRQGNISRNQ